MGGPADLESGREVQPVKNLSTFMNKNKQQIAARTNLKHIVTGASFWKFCGLDHHHVLFHEEEEEEIIETVQKFDHNVSN